MQRCARCALDPDNTSTCLIRTAGLAADVQWHLTAAHGDTYLVTATLTQEKNADRATFHVLSHRAFIPELLSSMMRLMTDTLASSPPALIAHATDDTPLKRLREITFHSSESPPAEMPLAACRRLE